MLGGSKPISLSQRQCRSATTARHPRGALKFPRNGHQQRMEDAKLELKFRTTTMGSVYSRLIRCKSQPMPDGM
ncbi:hypothetical protein SBBP2_730024 [Burkholderiales bacterium]|nr:hypothetical protein SBBP2_730024 [Burkholderiales bacterium]